MAATRREGLSVEAVVEIGQGQSCVWVGWACPCCGGCGGGPGSREGTAEIHAAGPAWACLRPARTLGLCASGPGWGGVQAGAGS